MRFEFADVPHCSALPQQSQARVRDGLSQFRQNATATPSSSANRCSARPTSSDTRATTDRPEAAWRTQLTGLQDDVGEVDHSERSCGQNVIVSTKQPPAVRA